MSSLTCNMTVPSNCLLLGPPELTMTTDSDPDPPFGFTENNSLTYLATGNPCLDFFFHVVPSTPSESVIERLQLAWNHDPLTTLKLICNLRAVRGTGKSDKERFFTAALWLHRFHPHTLACNVKVLVEFGCFKDLPEILYRLLEGEDVRTARKQEWKGKKKDAAKRKEKNQNQNQIPPEKKIKKKALARAKKKLKAERKLVPDEVRIARNAAQVEVVKQLAREQRKERELAMAKKAHDRYNDDPAYRFLYNCIANVFAEVLRADMQYLNAGELTKISLASKWCPSIDSAYDKATLICESIARRVFPRESYPEYEGIEERHYAYRVRDRLRKEVLVPLHKVLELPEVHMSAKQWNSLPYNRVASVAMTNYKDHFLKHDSERFNTYLEDVKSGKSTIAAGALLPHQIIASVMKNVDGDEVAELQWKRMVEDVAKLGKLNNCIAVCDVSGSMAGEPMEVCIALGMLLSELSEDPWKGKVITFSQNPQLHIITGDSLRSKAQFVKRMQWDMNTDFQKVFDQILRVAVGGKLREEEMIKRIFVFSDMEFDEATGQNGYYNSSKKRPGGWETDYEVIEGKFAEKGYKVPQIVFWNLRNSAATPVPSNQPGVALVSGFSKNLIKLFLENGPDMNPVLVMEKAISGELYNQLVVYD